MYIKDPSDVKSDIILDNEAAFQRIQSGENVYVIMVPITASGEKTAPGQTFLIELVAPTCGDETVSIRPEMQKVYSPADHRFNMTLNHTQITCKTDCVLVNEFEIKDAPLVSSSPFCPITDFKFMHDDGNGNPTQEPNPAEVRISKDTTGKMRMEIDTAAVAKRLQSGEKLNYVMIGTTANGTHNKPGETLMWEILLPGCSGKEVLMVSPDLKDMGMTP